MALMGRPLEPRGCPPRERDIQTAIWDALCRHPRVRLLARINSGRVTLSHGGKSRVVQFVRLFSRYYTPQDPKDKDQALKMPDLIGLLDDGAWLAIEVKKPGEDLLPGQEAFLQLVRQGGGIGLRTDAVETVLAALKGEVKNL